MLYNIEGDLLDFPAKIICHQCNCHTTMGAGIALAIAVRYPEVYNADCLAAANGRNTLGNISTAWLKEKDVYVVNIYGQDGFGRGKRNTNYEAVYTGLQKAREFAQSRGELSIAFPYGMGCGLGGGNWEIVKAMIEDVFKTYREAYIVRKL